MTWRLPKSMARRKAKRKSRRKQPIKILNLAQGVVVGNAVTMGLFGTSLRTFLTEGWMQDSWKTSGNPSSWDNSFEITLGEMFRSPTQGRRMSGEAGAPWSMGKVLQHNLRNNGPMMVGTLLLAGPAFKFGTRALAPLLRPVNKQLKPSGVVL
jgi:hypothetical protein